MGILVSFLTISFDHSLNSPLNICQYKNSQVQVHVESNASAGSPMTSLQRPIRHHIKLKKKGKKGKKKKNVTIFVNYKMMFKLAFD